MYNTRIRGKQMRKRNASRYAILMYTISPQRDSMEISFSITTNSEFDCVCPICKHFYHFINADAVEKPTFSIPPISFILRIQLEMVTKKFFQENTLTRRIY